MPSSPLPHQFHVPGSPVSVNRYGSPQYRNWRAQVYGRSVAAVPWTGVLVAAQCSVRVRYFSLRDRPKDVDNILKCIMDALDGKAGGARHSHRVLKDDRFVELVASQRTDLRLHKRYNARRLSGEEYAAAVQARTGQAAVYIAVGGPPSASNSMI